MFLIQRDQEPEGCPREDVSSPILVLPYHPNLSQNPFLEICMQVTSKPRKLQELKLGHIFLEISAHNELHATRQICKRKRERERERERELTHIRIQNRE
jgi:hypothetical protein